MTEASFNKPANTSYFALRFPRILKIHQDRTLKDAVGYNKLQELAKHAIKPLFSDKSKESCWIEKFQREDPYSSGQIIPTSDTGYQETIAVNEIGIA